MRLGIIASVLALVGCGGLGGGPGAADFVGADVDVSPGLASCLTAIGRADVVEDPTADMSEAEFTELAGCLGERSRG